MVTLSWLSSSDAYRASRTKHPAQRITLHHELGHRLLANGVANTVLRKPQTFTAFGLSPPRQPSPAAPTLRGWQIFPPVC